MDIPQRELPIMNPFCRELQKRCSDRERLADEAEREVDKMKKVEYMQAHIGEMYEGIISGVTSWGIYVELGQHSRRNDSPCGYG